MAKRSAIGLALLLSVASEKGVAMDLIAENLTISGMGPNPRVADAVATLFKPEQGGTADYAAGTFTSAWFTAHKGEIKLKVEAGISGTFTRFEAWQDTGLFFKSPSKTDAARRQEQIYEGALQDLLAHDFHQIDVELAIEAAGQPSGKTVKPSTPLTFFVTAAEPAFVAMFSTNSAGQPILVSDAVEAKPGTRVQVGRDSQPLTMPMADWDMRFGLVVGRSAETLRRYIETIRNWPQLEVDMKVDVGQ